MTNSFRNKFGRLVSTPDSTFVPRRMVPPAPPEATEGKSASPSELFGYLLRWEDLSDEEREEFFSKCPEGDRETVEYILDAMYGEPEEPESEPQEPQEPQQPESEPQEPQG